MPKTVYRVVENPDTKKFDVVQVLEEHFETSAEAQASIDDLNKQEEDEESEETKPEEAKTDANPHGLDIHERFSALLATLKKAGIRHSETSHPLQNPDTANDKFARKPADGQNALTVAEKTS